MPFVNRIEPQWTKSLFTHARAHAFSCAYIELWCTWEVWRALKKVELLSAAPRATLTHFTIWRVNSSLVKQWIFLESHNWIKIRKKEKSYNIICFCPERAPQKAISKSTVRTVIAGVSELKAGSAVHVWIFDNFIRNLRLFLNLFSNFFNKLYTILRITVVFHWIYKPFIFNIFVKFPNHFLEKENNLHLLPIWWKNWKR